MPDPKQNGHRPTSGVVYAYRGIASGSTMPDIPRLNRAFRYGDGIFETIRIARGLPLFYPHHYSRFIEGLITLGFAVPEHWQPEFFRQQILKLAEESQIPHGRLRITAWRNGEGRYLPDSDDPDWLLELEPLAEESYRFPSRGLTIDVAGEGVVLGTAPYHRVKSINSLPYILAARQARTMGWDDVLLPLQDGTLVEATSSNLFVFRNGTLYSPDPEQAGIDGVMRRVLVKIARKEGIPFQTTTLRQEHILAADEVFLCNVITGIRWVARFKDRTYSNLFSRGLFAKLEDKVWSDLNRSQNLR